MENVPSFDQFCYAPCTSPRPIIQNNKTVGNIEECTVEALNNDEDTDPNQNIVTHANIDETDANMANECLRNINCAKPFGFTQWQFEDSKKICK